MRISTIVATVVASCASWAVHAQGNVQALADRWAEAYNKHDRGALGGVYTDDALLMMHGAPTIAGKGEIAEFWAQDFEDRNPLTLLKVTPSVQGSDMTLVHGDYRVISRDDGSVLGMGRFAHIWTRTTALSAHPRDAGTIVSDLSASAVALFDEPANSVGVRPDLTAAGAETQK